MWSEGSMSSIQLLSPSLNPGLGDAMLTVRDSLSQIDVSKIEINSDHIPIVYFDIKSTLLEYR